MTTNPQNSTLQDNQEDVALGIIGAFLFSLSGGVVYFLLSLVGFFSSISGAIGVFAAIKGYAIFAKKESKKGIIISAIIAVFVMILAWYIGLSFDLYSEIKALYEVGEIDYVLSFSETVRSAYIILADTDVALMYFGDLFVSLVFCALGMVSPMRNALKRSRIEAMEKDPIEPIADETFEDIINGADDSHKDDFS